MAGQAEEIKEEEIKEMCNDMRHEIKYGNGYGGGQKLDLLFRSVHFARMEGYFDEKRRDALYDSLIKIANICNIKIGRNVAGMPIIKK